MTRKRVARPKPKLKAAPPPGPKYEYRVRYRRSWWLHPQGRIFQSATPAQRLVERLRQPWGDLARVVELYVQRRVVGPWEEVEVRRGVIVDYQPWGKHSHHRRPPLDLFDDGSDAA